MSRRRRFLVPEVVQTSAMDCGPAALSALAAGLHRPVDYGRLREACRTGVDGTSIDTLEEVAVAIGLDAVQTLQPKDHVLRASTASLPGIWVVRQPDGCTHFVVAWRRVGSRVQLMDPAVGRRWVRADRLLADLYLHEMDVPEAAWRAWAGTEGFLAPLRERLGELGIRDVEARLAEACEDPRAPSLARLDAATRFTKALVDARAVRPGPEAERSLDHALSPSTSLPDSSWAVRPSPTSDHAEEQVRIRGAVLVQVTGLRPAAAAEGGKPLDPALRAALEGRRARPARELWSLLREEGARRKLALLGGLCFVAATMLVEALLWRGLVAVSEELSLTVQRLGVASLLLALGVGMGWLEWRVGAELLRFGRALEVRLRTALLARLPRLPDRYVQSRPVSDLAERAHSVHTLRELPRLVGRFVRAAFALPLTVTAVILLDPRTTPYAIAAGIAAIAVPLLFRPWIEEADLRVRTHAGALGRFQLDALLGLAPIRAHGGNTAIRLEHEALLTEWSRTGDRLVRMAARLDLVQSTLGYGLAFAALLPALLHPDGNGDLLLVAYWMIGLTTLGEEFAALVQQLPLHKSTTLRLLEPLGTPTEDEGSANEASVREEETAGAALEFEAVRVLASGHVVLDGIGGHVEAGQHVAVVGASGAGKSTLLGLLLGWHRPAEGELRVDGQPLDASRLAALRARTAWVEPSVQLQRASLYENLTYGCESGAAVDLASLIERAELRTLLAERPDGLSAELGDGGRRLSGGEGQRVRFARALTRESARLVLLDEPFRGVDREQRRLLLGRAREVWRRATLLCVMHDLEETRGFDRVWVLDAGRLVEEGEPERLAADPGSRYRALLDQERSAARAIWSGHGFQRRRLVNGQWAETSA